MSGRGQRNSLSPAIGADVEVIRAPKAAFVARIDGPYVSLSKTVFAPRGDSNHNVGAARWGLSRAEGPGSQKVAVRR